MLDFYKDMLYTGTDKLFCTEVCMALRKERPEALELYRKMLIAFAGVAALVPFLLNFVSFMIPLLAAALFGIPALWWHYKAIRVMVRSYCIVLGGAVAVLCTVAAIMVEKAWLYRVFSLLPFMSVVLPAAAQAATRNAKFDIVLMRVLSFMYMAATALVIAYVIETKDWVESVLLGAVALVVFVLSIMICPPEGKKRKEK